MMEVIKPRTGEKYHLCWANNGCVWVLTFIGTDGTVKMRTPKTNKLITAYRKDLRHLRKNEINPH